MADKLWRIFCGKSNRCQQRANVTTKRCEWEEPLEFQQIVFFTLLCDIQPFITVESPQKKEGPPHVVCRFTAIVHIATKTTSPWPKYHVKAMI